MIQLDIGKIERSITGNRSDFFGYNLIGYWIRFKTYCEIRAFEDYADRYNIAISNKRQTFSYPIIKEIPLERHPSPSISAISVQYLRKIDIS